MISETINTFIANFTTDVIMLSEEAFLNKAFLVRALFIARDVFNVLSREKFRFVYVLRMSKLITKLILLLLTFCCVFLHIL